MYDERGTRTSSSFSRVAKSSCSDRSWHFSCKHYLIQSSTKNSQLQLNGMLAVVQNTGRSQLRFNQLSIWRRYSERDKKQMNNVQHVENTTYDLVASIICTRLGTIPTDAISFSSCKEATAEIWNNERQQFVSSLYHHCLQCDLYKGNPLAHSGDWQNAESKPFTGHDGLWRSQNERESPQHVACSTRHPSQDLLHRDRCCLPSCYKDDATCFLNIVLW